jgi:hypothetical protein
MRSLSKLPMVVVLLVCNASPGLVGPTLVE